MTIICTKCKSEDVYILPKEDKKPDKQTMDEFVKGRSSPTAYSPSTIKCRKCGYSIQW